MIFESVRRFFRRAILHFLGSFRIGGRLDGYTWDRDAYSTKWKSKHESIRIEWLASNTTELLTFRIPSVFSHRVRSMKLTLKRDGEWADFQSIRIVSHFLCVIVSWKTNAHTVLITARNLFHSEYYSIWLFFFIECVHRTIHSKRWRTTGERRDRWSTLACRTSAHERSGSSGRRF